MKQLIIDNVVYDLNKWITLAEFKKRHNVSIPCVANWIKRKKIPPSRVLVVSELNNIRLVHDLTEDELYELNSDF